MEMGLAATRRLYLRQSVGGEVFLLTSPFIERLRRAKRSPEGCWKISPGLSDSDTRGFVYTLFVAPRLGREDNWDSSWTA
jgi:hypothetical protein